MPEDTGEEMWKELSLVLNMFRVERTARNSPFSQRFCGRGLGSCMYKSSMLELSLSEKEEELSVLSMKKFYSVST